MYICVSRKSVLEILKKNHQEKRFLRENNIEHRHHFEWVLSQRHFAYRYTPGVRMCYLEKKIALFVPLDGATGAVYEVKSLGFGVINLAKPSVILSYIVHR